MAIGAVKGRSVSVLWSLCVFLIAGKSTTISCCCHPTVGGGLWVRGQGRGWCWRQRAGGGVGGARNPVVGMFKIEKGK